MPIQGKTDHVLRISSHPRQPSVWFYPPYLSAKHLPAKARHPGKLWMLHLWQNHAHGPGHSDRVLSWGPSHSTTAPPLEAATQSALDKSFQVTALSGGGEGGRLIPSPADLLSATQISSMGLWELHGDSPPHPTPPLALNCQQTPGL